MQNLIRLKNDQVNTAARVLARGFQDYPLWVRVFPDAAEREQKALPSMFKFFVTYGIRYGEVYATPNFEGVAIWFNPDKTHISMIKMIRTGALKFVFKVGLKYMLKMLTADKIAKEAHDRIVKSRHWYLFALGVDKVHQGKGYASVLLKSLFIRRDNEDLPTYLETHDEKTLPLYEHFGFKLIEKTNIAKLDVSSHAMLREVVRDP